MKNLKVRFLLGRENVPPGFQPFSDELLAFSDQPVERYVENEDAATILFTSGTTSFPKAVLNTHLNYYAALLSALHDLGSHHQHRVLLALPLFHSAGSYFLFSSVATGATITLLPRIEPQAILEVIPRDRITMTAFPATVWAGLDQVPGIDQIDFSSLKRVLVFQYLSTDVFKRWMERVPQADWINYWGQTEMIPLGASTRPGDIPRKLTAPDPIGFAHLPLEVRVVDEEMNDLPAGKVGELVTRGPACTPGYLEDREATEMLFRGGWLHTGDMAYKDEEGFLYFVDRKKDMIKTGGENVSSQEVEEILARHPKVAEVAVFGLPHPYWIEMVAAAVALKPGVQATEEELIAFAKEQMAHFKAPKRIFFVDQLPRNPSGKILKRKLQDQFADRV
ncbi:MAG: hypothetical protein BAA01_02280 [Bacillus thermozeamaize]|uniref:Acyl-CoA synthetase n=1 Tax=Bacillus thermozeamaize TaxID=230954 RepID=A0A1Y3PQA2_9BACI|nr:MAG: hypothetical protein BAA01_02280 [Bacillus thermozeamaize]